MGRQPGLEKDKARQTQHAQPSGPESLPHLQNQKHLLIASKWQRGSVSLCAAVTPHSDEHLKCQDPFQQLCTSNQALASVSATSRPLHLSPDNLFPRCVWRQGLCEQVNCLVLWKLSPWGGVREADQPPPCSGRRRQGRHTRTCGGLNLGRRRWLSTEG